MAKGINIELRMKNNRNRILNIIRNNNEISRFEIKKISKYSMSTVLSVVDELLKSKLINETVESESKVGRRPTWLELNPEGGYFIGLEFNGEIMYSVALDFTGKIVYSNCLKIDKALETSNMIIKKIKSNIREIIDFIGKPKDKIFGIGIGAPGLVDDVNGISINYPTLKNWNNIELKDIIQKEFNIKTYIDNNINAMALAYKWLKPEIYGEDFLLISVRTAVGMSLILNNQLYKGKGNTSGEIGHVRLESSNRICSCGKKGCLDTEVSNEGIRLKLLEGIERNRFRELLDMAGGDSKKVNIYSFVESVKKGHSDSIQLLDETCEYFSVVIANIVNILNPSRIIISGQITNTGELMLDLLRRKVKDKAVFVNTRDLIIENSSFDENIGAIGAAALVIQKEFGFTMD